jgi:hypothetical protein
VSGSNGKLIEGLFGIALFGAHSQHLPRGGGDEIISGAR